jgi:hypothetical protein
VVRWVVVKVWVAVQSVKPQAKRINPVVALPPANGLVSGIAAACRG